MSGATGKRSPLTFPLTLSDLSKDTPARRLEGRHGGAANVPVKKAVARPIASAVLAAPLAARAPMPVRPVGQREKPLVRALGVPQPRSSIVPAMEPVIVPQLTLTSDRVRERMVERIRRGGVVHARLLDAMRAIPRHGFVDAALAPQAYEEAALPIGHHQTISKPGVVARMIEIAMNQRVSLDRVLEVGTGCGYQAAILSRLVTEVFSIERIKPLHERAKRNLRPLRAPNIRLHYGDGRLGLPANAPFDAIIIAAAGLDVPAALTEQLAIGGRLIAPVGGDSQVLTLVERLSATQWRETVLDRVFFVPLKSGVI